eukprot:GHVU01079576.1.p1 GENE.GHVU01079576.1~~GHVU01079576.1.p1  ORF type:complete len:385 (+),score=31.50 GHVU01079576.1:114-1268(+)
MSELAVTEQALNLAVGAAETDAAEVGGVPEMTEDFGESKVIAAVANSVIETSAPDPTEQDGKSEPATPKEPKNEVNAVEPQAEAPLESAAEPEGKSGLSPSNNPEEAEVDLKTEKSEVASVKAVSQTAKSEAQQEAVVAPISTELIVQEKSAQEPAGEVGGETAADAREFLYAVPVSAAEMASRTATAFPETGVASPPRSVKVSPPQAPMAQPHLPQGSPSFPGFHLVLANTASPGQERCFLPAAPGSLSSRGTNQHRVPLLPSVSNVVQAPVSSTAVYHTVALNPEVRHPLVTNIAPGSQRGLSNSTTYYPPRPVGLAATGGPVFTPRYSASPAAPSSARVPIRRECGPCNAPTCTGPSRTNDCGPGCGSTPKNQKRSRRGCC